MYNAYFYIKKIPDCMFHWGIILGLILTLYITVNAQSTKVNIYINKTELAIDEPLILTVEVENATAAREPVFPDVEGLGKSGFSSQFQFGAAGSVRIYKQTYSPLRSGNITIPSFTYSTAGAKALFPTTQIKIHASKKGPQMILPDISDKMDVFARMELSKTEAWCGEAILQKIVLYINENEQHHIRIEPQSVVDLQQQLKNPGCWQEKIDFQQVPIQTKVIKGKFYTAYTLAKNVIFPNQPGSMAWQGLTVKLVKTNFDLLDPFGFPGHPQAATTVRLGVPTQVLTVRPLPPPPDNQTHIPVAVGSFGIEILPVDTNIYLHEPFNITAIVRGIGNIALLPPPYVNIDSTDIEKQPPVIQQAIQRQGDEIIGEKKFEFTLTPQRTGKITIGKFKLFVFHPETGTYDSLMNTEIKLTVKPKRSQTNRSQANPDAFYNELVHNAQSDTLTTYTADPFTNSYLYIWLIPGFILAVASYLNLRKRKNCLLESDKLS
jgi:hypothetical protein